MTRFLAIFREGQPVESAISGEKSRSCWAKRAFYVELGGQVSDTGTISGDGWMIEVEDTKRPIGGLIVHVGEVVEGTAQRSAIRRMRKWMPNGGQSITRNHTGTHLLQAALRSSLGTHVQQRGSLVAPDRLRFDFVHDQKVSAMKICGHRKASQRCYSGELSGESG